MNSLELKLPQACTKAHIVCVTHKYTVFLKKYPRFNFFFLEAGGGRTSESLLLEHKKKLSIGPFPK